MLVPAPPRTLRQPVHLMGLRYADGSRKYDKRSTALKKAVKGIPTIQLLGEAEESLRNVVSSNEVRRRTHIELMACSAEKKMVQRDSMRFAEEDHRLDLINESNIVWRTLTTQFVASSPGLLQSYSICLSQLLDEHTAGATAISTEEHHDRVLKLLPVELTKNIHQLPHSEWHNRAILEITSGTELSCLQSRHVEDINEQIQFQKIIQNEESNLMLLNHLRSERLSLENAELLEREEAELGMLQSLLDTHQRVRDGFKQLQVMDVPGRETINRGYMSQWEQGVRTLLVLKHQKTIQSASWLETLQQVERLEWEARSELEHQSSSEHLQHWITFQRGWCDVHCVVVQGEPARRSIVKSEFATREQVEAEERCTYDEITLRYSSTNRIIKNMISSLFEVSDSERWVRKGIEISTESAYLTIIEQQETHIRNQALKTALTSLEDEEQATRRAVYRQFVAFQVDTLFSSIEDRIRIDQVTHRLAIFAHFSAKHDKLVAACYGQMGKLQQSKRLMNAFFTTEMQARDQIQTSEYLSHSRIESFGAELKRTTAMYFQVQTKSLQSQLLYAERHQRLLVAESYGSQRLLLRSEKLWKEEYQLRSEIFASETTFRKQIYSTILTTVESHNRMFIEGEAAFYYFEELPMSEFFTREHLSRTVIGSIEQHCIDVYSSLHTNHIDINSAKSKLLPFMNIDTSQFNYPAKSVTSRASSDSVKAPSAPTQDYRLPTQAACATGGIIATLEAAVVAVEELSVRRLQKVGRGFASRIDSSANLSKARAILQGFCKMILAKAVAKRMRLRKEVIQKKRVAAAALEIPEIAILDPVPEDVLEAQQFETKASFTSLAMAKQPKPNVSVILLQYDARSIHRKEAVSREAINILFNQTLSNCTREFWDTLPAEVTLG